MSASSSVKPWAQERTYQTPDGKRLNVAAAARFLGLKPDTFWRRHTRKRHCAESQLVPLPMSYRDSWGRISEESAFLEADLIALRNGLSEQKSRKGKRKGWIKSSKGEDYLDRQASARFLTVHPATIDKLDSDGVLSPVWMRRPPHYSHFKAYPLARLKEIKKQRQAPPPDALETEEGRIIPAREARRILKADQQSLRRWGISCPYLLNGETLRPVLPPSPWSQSETWYREEQISTIQENRKKRPDPLPVVHTTPRVKFDGVYHAPDGKRYNLDAAERVSNLSRNFLKKQFKECLFLPEGRLPFLPMDPPSGERGRASQERTILVADLDRLQEGIAAALQKRKPLGWMTEAEIAKKTGARSTEERVVLGMLLRQWREDGRVNAVRIWRTGKRRKRWRVWCYEPEGLERCIAGAEMAPPPTQALNDIDPPPIPVERPLPEQTPFWDEQTGTLYWGKTVIRAFRNNPARNQKDLIEAFHRAGWTPTVSDPFKNSRTLNITIAALNKSLQPKLIKFRGDGTGEGVIWERTNQTLQTSL